MPIPIIGKWKSWKGTEVEGSNVGLVTVFIGSDSANANILPQCEHLYICPEVSSTKQLLSWLKAVNPTYLTLSLSIQAEAKDSFVLEVRDICLKNNVVFNLQCYIEANILTKSIQPDQLRLDLKEFTNISYGKINSVNESSYSNDEVIEQ